MLITYALVYFISFIQIQKFTWKCFINKKQVLQAICKFFTKRTFYFLVLALTCQMKSTPSRPIK